MNKYKIDYESIIRERLNDDELLMLDSFYENFKQRCLISKSGIHKIKTDIEKAILYYLDNGFKLEKTLQLLDPKNLGGFYARTSSLWFPLDDSGKIYPMSIDHGKMPVFRLSAYLKEDIVPELLQMALTFTIKRFPSFATTLKKGLFWHYLDTTKKRFRIREEDDVPCKSFKVGISEAASFRVQYYKNRISVEFFHVLTDGSGGMVFLKSLLSEYIRLLGVEIKEKGSIWDVNDIPTEAEVENTFGKIPHTEETSGLVNKRALQMSGKLTKMKPNQIIHFKFDSTKLKEVVKKYNTTIGSYFLALMFIAIKSSTDSLEGNISVQVPVNMKKFYDSVTVRNFAMYCAVNFDLSEINDIPELITNISEQIATKGSKEKMDELVTSINKLMHTIKFIPLFIKQPIAKRIYGFLGDQSFTSTFSNLGVVDMPEEYKNYIDSMDFVLGTCPNNRAICGLVSYNNVTNLSISKMTKDPTFEEKFYELLLKDGLEIEVEGSGIYEY